MNRRLFCFSLLFSPLVNAKEKTIPDCLKVDTTANNISYKINKITGFKKHHIHSYFDLNPDSPDCSSLLCFRFLGRVPGIGSIIVYRDFDPNKATVVAEGVHGTAHEAALQQWLSDEAIAYVDFSKKNVTTEIISTDAKRLMSISGGLRSANIRTMLGLFSSHELRRPNRKPSREFVQVVDLNSGMEKFNIVIDDLLKIDELNEILVSAAGYQVKHPKWSVDGNHFFFVLYKKSEVVNGPKKVLIMSDKNGVNINYIGEFLHHPVWDHTGRNIYYFGGRKKDQILYRYNIVQRRAVPVIPGILGDHLNVHVSGRFFIVDKVTRSKSRDGQIVLINDAGKVLYRHSYEGDNISYKERLHPHPIWSRDGCSVFANVIEKGIRGVVKIDLSTT